MEYIKHLELADLTKDELIILLKERCVFSYKQKDLRMIRWCSLVAESQKIMGDACEEMDRLSGSRDMGKHVKWLAASERFDKGMKLSDDADQYLHDEN